MGSAVEQPWGDPNLAQRVVRRIAATSPGAWLLSRTLRPIDSVILRLTSGRATFTSIAAGLPVVVLITTGARTGLPRRTVVLGIPFGSDIAVVAGNFGQAPPAWQHNLLRHPQVTARIGGRSLSLVARPVGDDERQSVLDAAIRVYPPYAVYATRTQGRAFRLFLLGSDPSVGS